MSFRWAELALRPDRKRFETLSAVLNEKGFANEVEFLGNREDGELAGDESEQQAVFEMQLHEAISSHVRIRLGGEFCLRILKALTRAPSVLVTMGCADAMTPFSNETGRPLAVDAPPAPFSNWWPRCFLAEGLQRMIVTDLGRVDLSGGVFVLGTGFEARAVIAAMTRLGFNKFTISDLATDSTGDVLVAELRRSYFECQFQFVERHLITQLPSVNSVAVNTLVGSKSADQEGLSELFYFNFLKPQGLWLDLSCVPTRALDNEAKAMDLTIATGAQASAWADCEWAREVLGISLSPSELLARYNQVFAVES